MAFRMSLAVTETESDLKSSFKEGMAVLVYGRGCLSWRATKVVSSGGANVSSEQAILMAPLKSPSSSLAETRPAKDLRGSLDKFWPLL